MFILTFDFTLNTEGYLEIIKGRPLSLLCTSFHANVEYISSEKKEVSSMSSIITIISSSPLLIGIFTFLTIIIIGSLASKVAEVMGKWELAKRIHVATYLLGICFIVGLILVYIAFIFGG